MGSPRRRSTPCGPPQTSSSPCQWSRRCRRCRRIPGSIRGYAPLGSEALSYSIERRGTAARPVRSVQHRRGRHDRRPLVRRPVRVLCREHLAGRGAGVAARARDVLPSRRGVTVTMTEVFSVALGLGEQWFRPYVDRSTTTMRVNNYEHRAGDPRRIRADADGPPHRLRRRDGALRRPGAGAGDHRAGRRLVSGGPGAGRRSCSTSAICSPSGPTTNGGRPSTGWYRHRSTPPVGRSAGRSRSSSTPTTTPTVECLPTCCGADRPPRYPAVVAGEHLMAKIMGPRRFERSTATVNTALGRLDANGTL